MRKKIYILMVLATLFWAGAFIAGKVSAGYLPPFTLTFLRFFIATIILYILLKIMKKPVVKLDKNNIHHFIITGLVGMFGYHVFFFNSLKYTSPVNSSMIGASNPIITTILSALILKESLKKKKLFGIFISFIGVLLTLINADINVLRSLSFNTGDILMLIAVLCWSSYSVYSKKIMGVVDPYSLTLYSFLFCTIFTLPFSLYEAPYKAIISSPPSALLSVVYMAIFPSVIGYLVQQLSIKEIGPSKTSIFINLVPVFSIVLSILILKESVSYIKLITALIIITGVYICQRA